MKRVFALMLTALLAFGMFGCGGSDQPADDSAMLTDEGLESMKRFGKAARRVP